MACVHSVRFSVRINGSTLDPFIPSRGLRQGDPLSPYLFLLVGEALTCILKTEVVKGNITPLKVARRAPGISNLLFAEDCVLFFKATKEEAQAITNALNLFQRCTEQLLSTNKCSVLFSQVCPSQTQDEIKATLNVVSFTFEEKYLGLPTPEGRMKVEQFQPIMVRFSKRLTNWAERFMSHGAKDTLIKSVAQALPTHGMGVFKMSTGFCDQYEKLKRDFWWGDDQNQRKVHWLAWENMIKPKCKGGIGFQDISLFNQALLARQAWRLMHRPNSLCARILKAKYYPNGNILDTVFAVNPSPAWRGVEFGLELLKEGIIKRIGNGRNTQFSRDNWLPRDSGLKLAGLKKNSRQSYEDTKGKRAVVPCQASTQEPAATLPRWSAPPPGWVKLNTDGSLPPNSTTGGAGAVARDCTGKVLFAACTSLHNCTDAEEAEARAALWGLNLMSRHDPPGVVLEMDCLASVAALQSNDQDRSRLWNVYIEAKNRLLNLKVCAVKHSRERQTG
ncbi:hypothetical protein ACQ4PT_013166 [Festuca glaucescens]